MHDHGGKGRTRRSAAWLTGLLLVAVLTGCTYEDERGPQAPGPPTSPDLPAAAPTADRALLDLTMRNFTELKQLLGVAPGTLLLEDSVAVGGPGVGFRKNAMVETAGTYTVTAACVGAPDVRLSLNQDPQTGAGPLQLVVVCSQATSQIVQLRAGYVSAALLQLNPGSDPWTGAVAGVRITVTAEP